MKKAYLHLAAMVALSLVFLSTEVRNGECFNNATRIADNMLDAEEFLMESESARRVLMQPSKTVTYPTVNGRNKPACKNGDNLCDKASKNYQKRKCDYINKCKRPGG